MTDKAKKFPVGKVVVVAVVFGLLAVICFFVYGAWSFGQLGKPLVWGDAKVVEVVQFWGSEGTLGTLRNPYGMTAGFQDPVDWVAFTLNDAETAWAFAVKVVDVGRDEFLDWSSEAKELKSFPSPEDWGVEWKTDLWNPNAVVNGKYAEINNPGGGRSVLIDTDQNRVFVYNWTM